MLDLIVRKARTVTHETLVDIACAGGKIVEVAPRVQARATKEIDGTGCLVTPPFVDSHFHMDATLSYGLPRVILLLSQFIAIP